MFYVVLASQPHPQAMFLPAHKQWYFVAKWSLYNRVTLCDSHLPIKVKL